VPAFDQYLLDQGQGSGLDFAGFSRGSPSRKVVDPDLPRIHEWYREALFRWC